ncbi:hypothetical protein EJF18_30333 [Clavispora lusitaniae]|uniref:Uncharacterized protein n=1 Tax=Clavispora lusitaniae TaxID=36911 RepID=A0ACD0WIJ7_CLALS|nr:hypothetical protein EJF14_30333 [Clavispora lusitaniae]QFZ33328.1 hypothetical protein EJF16_30333 [Clavispora lusitaniae]QFZ38999.1 hypothetical protein EJF15_30333 [Clavispora lusitaniae]QFZ44681.1 hypothetical protein EJF18_30333 [Clavispora lusitaniae]QFZ50358.1 hypothetical protein EJF17_30333 [Clavispora lusitaniae]
MSSAAQILTRVWLTPHPYVTLQIGPVDGVVFASDPESDTMQIGLSKRKYLELFTEGHHFLEGRNWSADVASMGDVELWRFFLATAALLATTNDHSTAWRLHERVVGEMALRECRDEENERERERENEGENENESENEREKGIARKSKNGNERSLSEISEEGKAETFRAARMSFSPDVAPFSAPALFGSFSFGSFSAPGLSLAAALSLRFCAALATSRLVRINKSPLLWTWLRKLAVAGSFSSQKSFRFFFETTLRSMALHFANYHAAFTAHWSVSVARAHGLDPRPALALLRPLCRANLADVSAWTALARILAPQPDPLRLYRQLEKETPRIFGVTPQKLTLEPMQSEVSDSEPYASPLADLQWLLSVKCAVVAPYCILGAVDLPAARHLLREYLLQNENKESSSSGVAPENSTNGSEKQYATAGAEDDVSIKDPSSDQSRSQESHLRAVSHALEFLST